ncbi:MAG: radical SAM protein [Caldithrix sp.]|nr:radical SAM protein [Caldithrix sp.]
MMIWIPSLRYQRVNILERGGNIMDLHIPSVPHLVHIETTYACNQWCRFCYNPNRNMKINLGVIDKIVESIYESWVPHVYLIGGEPSLLGAEKLNEYIELLSKRSSVTIVTNGQAYLDGLSGKLACLGVPIHGLENEHDFLAGKKGSFRTAFDSIKKYVQAGFDVRCIPVLTRVNYDQMYDVIKLAKRAGMESIFVDRYEDGGVGSARSAELKPSLEQFRIALGQMIDARDDFGIPVGWGTAIPFCLDERLLNENMSADCGAGVTFCAINPKGDLRLCNQSEIYYGNVLEERIEDIWHKSELGEFRNLSWVEKPCSDCFVLSECMCGCKVDASKSDSFCIDYAVRENGRFCEPEEMHPGEEAGYVFPEEFRRFKLNRYARLNTFHQEKYLVTRYQTILLDDLATSLAKQIFSRTTDEEVLVKENFAEVDIKEVRKFVSTLGQVGVIDFVED